MGTVWLAEHIALGRKVAIKVLHPHLASNANLRARFRKEAITLSKLQHPNIVAFYDLIETADQVCLVMEHVQGRNLDEIIRKEIGPMPAERLSSVFKQILLAFDHAHRAGVVHRDIKPSNFMLSDDGVVKVLDFGIAKLLEDDMNLTRTGLRMGTTFYMSPEQVNGGAVDHRSDIYSLGVTLFVLATGQNPYEGETVEFKVYNRIVHEPLPKARSIYPGVPEPVERLIEKATAKDPSRRFQNCGEFLIGAGIEAGTMVPANDGPKPSLAEYKGLRRFSRVAVVAGVMLFWVPGTGNVRELGNISGLAALAGIAISIAAIGILRGKSWSKWTMRAALGMFGLGSVLAVIFPGSSSTTSRSRYWTGSDGMMHSVNEVHNNNFLTLVVCGIAILFAIWGLSVVFSKNSEGYWEKLS